MISLKTPSIISAVVGFSFAPMLGLVPSPEKIDEIMPFIQASAFTVMAVNNGVQLAQSLKDTKPKA